MHRMPGFILLFVLAVAVMYWGADRPVLAAQAGAAQQSADEEAAERRAQVERQAIRLAYQRAIEDTTEQIELHRARLRRYLMEHEGSSAEAARHLRMLRKSSLEQMAELVASETIYDEYNRRLEAGDFEPDDTIVLAIEQSPQMLEIDREMLSHRVNLNLFEALAGDNTDHPSHQKVVEIRRRLVGYELHRSTVYDQLVRVHFNARLEDAARRVSVARAQLDALGVLIDEAEARHGDAVRAAAERARIERAQLAAERRLEQLRARVQDAMIELDIAEALGD